MVGIKVKHNIFGVGTVLALDGNIITVEFSAGKKKFVYPDAFEKFIEAEDQELQSKITKGIKHIKNNEPPRIIVEPDFVNTFVFKNERCSYKNVSGYAVYDLRNNNKIGVVWSHKHKKGELADGQAEIRFFDEYNFKYHTWRRIFQNYQRLDFDVLEKMIEEKGSVTLTIDPWQG